MVNCLACLPFLVVAAKASPPKEVSVETPIKRPSITSATTKRAVEDRQEKLTGIGKAMVKSMQDALEIPHFGYCDEISCDSLIRYGKSAFEFIFAWPPTSCMNYIAQLSTLQRVGTKLSTMPLKEGQEGIERS